MKRLIALLLAGLTVFSLVGCGGSDNDDNGGVKATEIFIAAGGSSEFTWTEGEKDKEVIDYIENKYFQETGKRVNFTTNLKEGQSMKIALATEIKEGKIDVVVSHTRGGDGIDDWAYKNDLYANHSRMIKTELKDAIDNGAFTWTDGTNTFDALKAVTTPEGSLIGIPSVINPYKFGILVRKDWMEAIGYTDDVTKEGQEWKNGQNWKIVDNFKTFEEMAVAMKNDQGLDHVLTGAIFDLEKAGVLGANGVNAGYYSNTVYKDGDKNYVGMGVINPDYAKVVELEQRWTQKGILAPNADQILIDTGEQNFLSGRTGIFLQDPTVTHLIEVAKKTKDIDPNAEFTVLGALPLEKGGTDVGFMRNTVATFCAFVPKTSQNAREVFRFMKWVYSSKENYLLCKYGREGIDWIYDEANQTYSYKSEKDFKRPPYSGILALVENQNIANLTYAGYTDQEKGWIEQAKNKDFYVTNDAIDYMLIVSSKDLSTRYGNAQVELAATLRPLWGGGTSTIPLADALQTFVTSTKEYLEFMYNNVYSELKKG